jgi:hypothetical protein
MKTTIKSNKQIGLVITLDSSEVFPNDPGMGTPALRAQLGAAPLKHGQVDRAKSALAQCSKPSKQQ